MGIYTPGVFFVPLLFLLLFVTLFPWYLGFTWVRVDANRRGQPGWLWAFVTVPLGWLAILAYLVVRSITPRP